MKRILIFVFVLICGFAVFSHAADTKAATPAWSLNATAIEACSCPMFCQCYFNAEPAGHHDMGKEGHYCKFNNAYKINSGKYGNVDLTGGKFWLNGDLGADFSKGQMDWVIATFDKNLTKEQRDALGQMLPKLFPVKWNSFTTSEGDIAWEASKDAAHATIDGGKVAEVRLKRFPGMTNEPVVITNLKYWGAPRNDGFVLMPNEINSYKVGPKAYETKGTNGFMLTLDMNSKDFEAHSTGGSH